MPESRGLKDKFTTLLVISLTAVTIIIVLGVWRYKQFTRNKDLIRQSSIQLQHNLQLHFEMMHKIGDIRADLAAFMQTASTTDYDKVQTGISNLLAELPPEFKPILTSFQDKLSTLGLRMASLRTNNLTAQQNGDLIMATVADPAACNNNSVCEQALSLAGQTFREYQPNYIAILLSGSSEELDDFSSSISLRIENLQATLQTNLKNLSGQEHQLIKQIADQFYDLEDAVVTVAAIKQKVFDSRKMVSADLHLAEDKLSTISLATTKDASTLVGKGLTLSSSFAIIMFSSMGVLTLLFLTFGAIMTRDILDPLTSLVYLLKQFSNAITKVGRQSDDENKCYDLINSLLLKRNDEIADVVRATKELMDRMRGIAGFRKTIEADSSIDEVFFRLARLFTNKLDLDTFIIYEVTAEGSMLPAYCSPPALEETIPDFSISDTCRSKRTGEIISSFADPEICRVCELDNTLNYYCIPMLAGGRVVGVIQFILPFSTSTCSDETRIINEKLSDARVYIEEALPIIEAKRFARQLEEMATTDQLTGLFNRRYLELSLQQITEGIKRRETHLGVLMCDMDFFKEVNDTYGHDSGDIVLRELAAILQRSVRASDMVCRYGGEEFLILLMDTQQDAAAMVAEKIRARVEGHTFNLASANLKKTISIGVSEFPNILAQGVWEVIKQADVGLYEAKSSGRNKVVKFEKGMWTEDHY